MFTHLFTNRYTKNLPADDNEQNYPRHVERAAFSFVEPIKTSNPQLIAFSDDLANTLGFDNNSFNNDDLAHYLTGNKLINGLKPYAMCYGGHQFGHWAGQLGDGRAIALGEIKTPHQGYKTLQLKGAGPTPYSRTADGLAVLRSSIREFLCSEAMYHLGVPTTRALSLSLTGDQVRRDMFYDGNAAFEPGAVVCRVSSSFTRFGTFQLPASRQDTALLKTLVDKCIKDDFPHITDLSTQGYIQWFNEVCARTCALVVNWLRVGFVHGVLNTDNMSIIGETIDFGPYGWVDNFDPNWTPNTTDNQNKRYRFGAQAKICRWNLCQLGNALFPLLNDASPLQTAIDTFVDDFHQQWGQMMANKIGLASYHHDDDFELFINLEELLASVETDMTLFYRSLAHYPWQKIDISNQENLEHFEHCYYSEAQLSPTYKTQLDNWLSIYRERLQSDNKTDPQQRIQQMNSVNPKFVLRNYLSQQAIDKAEKGDYSELHTLQTLLKNPYDEQPAFDAYAQKRPAWAKNKAGCSALSCSS